MNVIYRQGRKSDCLAIAQLNYLASEGAIEFLFHDLVPNMTTIEFLSSGLEQDIYPHTFRSTIVAEIENQVIGSALSYPAEFHRITEELANFLPADRLDHFRDFYSSRVEGSYLLDAICVHEKFRDKGIGKSLLESTKKKAVGEGYTELSLIVFSDNKNAINFYLNSGFEQVKSINLQAHELIPHDGGCILMRCSL